MSNRGRFVAFMTIAMLAMGAAAQASLEPEKQAPETALPAPPEPPRDEAAERLKYRQKPGAAQTEWLPAEHQAISRPAGIPVPEGNPVVERFLKLYESEGGKAWLKAIMERAVPWRDHIAGRIRYYGLPEELLYLPVVESAFTPGDVSKSGAAGLWQFMKNSIGGYDMKIDDWRDDRRDFVKATDGALRKLKYNYDRFGTWELALAAYNCGVGKLERAMKTSGATDYWELSAKKAIPSETINYVPKFLAIASMMGRAGRNGIEAGWTAGPTWELVEVDKPVDVTMLAERAGIPKAIVKKGNAELKYNVTPPGSYRLKVPAEYAEATRAALADKEAKLLRFHLYAIKRGDTLSALSKHYDVSVSMIQQYNPGIKPNALQLGQKLVIPALTDVGPYTGSPKPSAPKDERPYTATWNVKKGDTLWAISLAVSALPENIAAANGLTMESILREGMTLKVPILN